MDRGGLERQQLQALNQLLGDILPANRFYREKLGELTLPLTSLAQLSEFPLTSKEEFVQAGNADPPDNLTFSLDHYVRLHQTSGTRGTPLRVYDTAEDWQWWIDTWQYVLDAAQVTSAERALMAFSFGPFIGFWSAYDALAARGCLVIPTGGMSTQQRLDVLTRCCAEVVCCTPTYAMRIAEVAAEEHIDLQQLGVRSIIVAGEPGGSIPAVRDRIEAAWGAMVVDHAGATEVGPWGFADAARTGLHVIENQFIAEFLPVEESELSELVLTALGRSGWPVIRYRTGDLVRPKFDVPSPHGFVLLEGGVLGRVDEMLIIRGVNIYASAIDEIVCSQPGIAEYRAVASNADAMDELVVSVEPQAAAGDELAAQLAGVFQQRLGLRVAVEVVTPGTLPRFEAKSRRLLDERTK